MCLRIAQVLLSVAGVVQGHTMKRSNERGQLSKEEYERDEEEYGGGGGADTFRKADER